MSEESAAIVLIKRYKLGIIIKFFSLVYIKKIIKKELLILIHLKDMQMRLFVTEVLK
jgi:hypothetical protein